MESLSYRVLGRLFLDDKIGGGQRKESNGRSPMEGLRLGKILTSAPEMTPK